MKIYKELKIYLWVKYKFSNLFQFSNLGEQAQFHWS